MKNALFKFLPLCFLLTSCGSSELKPDGKTPEIPVERVFNGEYNDIEMAIRAAMKKYPIKEDSLDLGSFDTEYIRGDRMYRPPGSPFKADSGTRYHIVIHVIKGKIEGKPGSRVILKKVVEKNRDFFSDSEPLASDGLEENIIFYRIQRELNIARAVKRAAENPTPAK